MAVNYLFFVFLHVWGCDNFQISKWGRGTKRFANHLHREYIILAVTKLAMGRGSFPIKYCNEEALRYWCLDKTWTFPVSLRDSCWKVQLTGYTLTRGAAVCCLFIKSFCFHNYGHSIAFSISNLVNGKLEWIIFETIGGKYTTKQDIRLYTR